MKSVEFLLDILCRVYNDSPDKARVIIDEKLYKRIKSFQRTVKKLDAHSIRDWDCSPEFLLIDLDKSIKGANVYKEYDIPIDCITLDVSKTDIWWHGYFKHSNETVETSMITIKDLDECFKVLRYKKEDLPLLLGTLKSEKAKEIYEKRLKRT